MLNSAASLVALELERRRRRRTPTPATCTPRSLAAQIGMTLYPYQQRVLDAWQTPRRIVLKARQVGFSTVVALEALAVALSAPGSTVLLISRNQALAANLLRSCYQMLLQVPNAPSLTTENDFAMEFTTHSRILSQPATRSAGRGFSANLVVLDEFAYAQYADAIYQSVAPALAASGGRLIVGSTPNGEGNAFADLWHGAEDWHRTEIGWQDCPAYYTPAEQEAGIAPEDCAWYVAERPRYTAAQWAAEFDRSFAGSGDNVFRADAIAGAAAGAWGPQPPRPGRRYLTSVDVGRRQDATVINTFDLTERPYQRVHHERLEHRPYPVLQRHVEAAIRRYGGALLIESNGVGDPFIENLNVHASPFTTTAKSKVQALQALALLLERGDLKAQWTPQERRELSQYRYDDSDLVQDCVMSLAIGAHGIMHGSGAILDYYQRRAASQEAA